jgi:hypothetical protein
MPYKEENKIIWEEFLTNVDIEFAGYVPKIYNNNYHNAIIIEPREHQDLRLSIRSTMYYLNNSDSQIKWGLQIFHGNKNKDYIKKIINGWKGVELVNIGIDDFTNIEHSQYMESHLFWEKVKGTKVLIFQTDSVLLRSGIDEFLGYDYIGAPWRKLKEGQIVGNGGLSLRTKDVMLKITQENGVPEEQIWEDIYFMKHMKGVGVADYETAKRFSMEDIYSPNPLGVHNPIRHVEPHKLREVLLKK